MPRSALTAESLYESPERGFGDKHHHQSLETRGQFGNRCQTPRSQIAPFFKIFIDSSSVKYPASPPERSAFGSRSIATL